MRKAKIEMRTEQVCESRCPALCADGGDPGRPLRENTHSLFAMACALRMCKRQLNIHSAFYRWCAGLGQGEALNRFSNRRSSAKPSPHARPLAPLWKMLTC